MQPLGQQINFALLSLIVLANIRCVNLFTDLLRQYHALCGLIIFDVTSMINISKLHRHVPNSMSYKRLNVALLNHSLSRISRPHI